MNFIQFVKRVCINFMIVAGACLIATTLFCTLFVSDLSFGVKDLWMVILMAFLTSMTIFIYYSKKEISKNSMKMRRIMQMVLVVAAIFGVAFGNNWVKSDHLEQVIFLLLAIVIITISVSIYNFRLNEAEARRLTQALEKFRDED